MIVQVIYGQLLSLFEQKMSLWLVAMKIPLRQISRWPRIILITSSSGSKWSLALLRWVFHSEEVPVNAFLRFRPASYPHGCD